MARITPTLVPAIRGTVRYPDNSPAMLAQIHAPTLILAGEEDHSNDSGVQHAQEVQAAISGSRLITIPRAGHALLIEQRQPSPAQSQHSSPNSAKPDTRPA